MPGRKFGLGHFRQPAHHRQAAQRLHLLHQRCRRPGRAAVQQNRRCAMGRMLCQKPRQAFQLLGRYHQQRRQAQRLPHLPCAGPGRAAHTVVITHGPFGHHSTTAAAAPGKQRLHGFGLAQIQIQIPAFHPQHGAVKAGVDVIRAALKGAGVQPPALQKRQQRHS